MQSKNIIRMALATALLLLVPLLAGAPWSLGDFVLAGGLLIGTGVAYELVASRGWNIAYRAAVGIALATGLLLVCSNLAVGIIGSEDNPANLMYFGVLALGIGGAFIARFQSRGMARALIATAIAQALVTVIAITVWRPPANFRAVEVFGNVFFVALWIVSAFLFRRAEGRGRRFSSSTAAS
jgi:hypothetical protein